MRAAKGDLVKLLMIFERTLQEMSEDELRQLMDGHANLKVVPVSVKETVIKAVKAKPVKAASVDLKLLAKKLAELDTREGAREIIVKAGMLKNDLIQLAEWLEVYVSKNDSKEKMIEKIIESTAGARMRSKAIEETRIGAVPSGRKGS